ncbi:MAG TPA: SURF1 family protein [Anaerolineales bacterium]
MIFIRMFSRRWLLTTLLVIAGMAVTARLGIWQLDRLAQRRAFNARVEAQINQPSLDLSGDALNADLAHMEYRKVTVTGSYDFSQEVVLRNQAYNGQWGVNVITPLHIAGTDQSILVERGWVPGSDFTAGNLAKYFEPGLVKVQGVIRASEIRPDFGFRADPTPSPGGPRLVSWNLINVGGISQQVSYPLLPVYIQEAPDPAWTGMPVRSQPELDLTEGPHMGYALQWFSFALILGGGYPFFIRRQENRPRKEKAVQKIDSAATVADHQAIRDDHKASL